MIISRPPIDERFTLRCLACKKEWSPLTINRVRVTRNAHEERYPGHKLAVELIVGK